MIAGLIPVEHGSIHLGEENISQLSMHHRAQKGLSYLAQEPSVFRKLNVHDNIMAILETNAELSKDQREEICDQLLQDFNLGHLRENTAMGLSGGERRRLEIARALAVNPKFILLDEPFAGVDPISVVDIQKIIKALANRGIGILITDHNVRETLGICDRAYIINEGTIIAEGNPKEILDNEQVRMVYLGKSFTL
jgi:lipopolysaccharide export system ATP-binding protein